MRPYCYAIFASLSIVVASIFLPLGQAGMMTFYRFHNKQRAFVENDIYKEYESSFFGLFRSFITHM
jgi:hypothetical protein